MRDHSLFSAASTAPDASFDLLDFNLFLLFVILQSALIMNIQGVSCIRLTENFIEENRLIRRQKYMSIY